MKYLIFAIVFFGSSHCFAQTKQVETILVTNISLILGQNYKITIPEKKNIYSNFYYWPQKTQGARVIHVNSANINFDDVYYVDKSGTQGTGRLYKRNQ